MIWVQTCSCSGFTLGSPDLSSQKHASMLYCPWECLNFVMDFEVPFRVHCLTHSVPWDGSLIHYHPEKGYHKVIWWKNELHLTFFFITTNPTMFSIFYCSIFLYQNHEKKLGQLTVKCCIWLISSGGFVMGITITSISTQPQAYCRQPLGFFQIIYLGITERTKLP